MKKKTIEEKAFEILNKKGFEDHKRPNSRRDFIKLGLLAGGGALMPISFMDQVFAATTKFRPTIPFLVFDLAGGASMPGNFLVGQKGGPEDLCENYKAHGWNPRAAGALDHTFGLPMSTNNSRMLEGLRNTLPSEILNQGNKKLLQMASFCHFSLDDTTSNRSSALTLMSHIGLTGSVLKSGIGQRGSASGGNSSSYLEDSQLRPKLIQRFEDINTLTSLGDRFLGMDESAKSIVRQKLVEAGQEHPGLINAYKELSQFGSLHTKGDPTQSEEMIAAYNLNNNPNEATRVEAGIVYNVLQGYTGPGVITIPGCDYHDGTQTTGDNKDLEIGTKIGQAIHAAHLLGQPFFFQIITDGGVYAPGSDNYDRRWLGDQNLHSLTVIGYYDPRGKTQMRRLQVGHYTPNAQLKIATAEEEARGENFISKKPENMVLAVLANYLHLHGAVGEFQALSGSRLDTNIIDELLVFG